MTKETSNPHSLTCTATKTWQRVKNCCSEQVAPQTKTRLRVGEGERERGDYGRDMGGPKAMKDRRRSKQDDRSKHRTYAYACGATTVVRLARRRPPRRSRRGTTVPLQRLGSGSKCDFHSSGLRLSCLFCAKNMLRCTSKYF